MAGIGFELKKLFQKRGLAATAKAYGYAGVICTGPMLLGIVLLVGIAFICDHTGATRHNRELLNCMITYTLLVSLTVTSFFSMVTISPLHCRKDDISELSWENGSMMANIIK